MATVLHSLVVSCAKKLQEVMAEEAILILGVKGELRELLRTMNQIQCFINDAEQRRTEELCNTRKFHHNKILLATWLSFIFSKDLINLE
jgi:hypothetical protein